MEHDITQRNKESQHLAQILAVSALSIVVLIIIAYFRHWY